MSEQQIKFATDADRHAWEIDFMAFGQAIVGQHGKHIPLKDMQPLRQSRFDGVTYGRSPAMDALPLLKEYNALTIEQQMKAASDFVQSRLADWDE